MEKINDSNLGELVEKFPLYPDGDHTWYRELPKGQSHEQYDFLQTSWATNVESSKTLKNNGRFVTKKCLGVMLCEENECSFVARPKVKKKK